MNRPGRVRSGPGRLSGLFASGPGGTPARTPFVLLVVVLLGSGLITLLLLNSALNQGSFELSKLEKRTDELKDEQQALQQEVDAFSAPGALEQRARELGMVPGGSPAFLEPDGTVRGKPSKAGGGGVGPMSAPGPSRLAVPAPRPAPGPAAAPAAGPRPSAGPRPAPTAPDAPLPDHPMPALTAPGRPLPGSAPTTSGR
ncbi:FtsB family cell division protein [Streptomyces rimosus]|uniref:FtsB family cell division protein n=1 Tax=Streptomyces rimosus TaxID=1927 RepID=UPI00067C7924|nr:septum formation initiator family protein [Streptomyces rimosus]